MKPSIPSGTRDFSPADVAKRNYILSVLKNTFERYGYQPIETPAMENLETLTGKYGEEGDNLIFKILNSGNYLESAKVRKHVIKDIAANDFSKLNLFVGDHYPLQFLASSNEILGDISGKALRYDLTVPFARYVVLHQHEITFPFKRYQMQPVWRADRPQKGRYREFYQCDVVVIGSNSLLNEVELLQMMNEVFGELMPAMNFSLKINSRKILKGFAEVIGLADRLEDLTTSLDKIEKVGMGKVLDELKEKEFAVTDNNNLITRYLENSVSGSDNNEKMKFLKELLNNYPDGCKGIEEMEFVLKYAERLNIPAALDIVLARGLNYYTGVIFEVKPVAVTLSSSMCGGGRYDNLTGIFGLPDLSGVGVSFGIERIIDVMHELNRFEELKLSASSSKIMFVNFGPDEEKYCLPLVASVRASGINAELYPDQVKVKKQFEYADKKKIPYVVVIGTEEMKTGNLTLKDMKTGQQNKLTIEEIIDLLKGR